jgi:hypothetical protein
MTQNKSINRLVSTERKPIRSDNSWLIAFRKATLNELRLVWRMQHIAVGQMKMVRLSN